MKYKIYVKVLNGAVLCYNVNSYEIENNTFVKFTDTHHDIVKRYPVTNCEIIEDKDGNTQ